MIRIAPLSPFYGFRLHMFRLAQLCLIFSCQRKILVSVNIDHKGKLRYMTKEFSIIGSCNKNPPVVPAN
jgi:hypothetical protein